MNEKIARTMSKIFSEENSLSQIKIAYFFETLIGELEKGVLLIVIFAMEGFLREILVVLCVILLVRPYVGGTHCSTFWGCYIYTFFFCLIAVFLPNVINMTAVVQGIVTILTIVFLCVNGPVISSNRPEYSRKYLWKIRKKGFVGVLLVNVLYGILPARIQVVITCTFLLVLLNGLVGALGKKCRRKGGDGEGEEVEERNGEM